MNPDETSESKHYVWIRDGLPVTGTLREYAEMWEGDYYAGDVDLSTTLLRWDGRSEPVMHRVHIKAGEITEDDRIFYTLSTNKETVRICIDGRS